MTEKDRQENEALRLSEGFKHEQIFVLSPQTATAFQSLTGKKGMYLTDVGFFPHAQGHYRARPSGIPTAILLYVRKGKGRVQIRNRVHELLENEALVIPPGEPHLYFADQDDPWSLFWVHAGGAALAEFPIDEGKKKLTGERAAQRMELYFEMIFQTLSDGLTEANFRYLDRLLQTVFAEVFCRETGGNFSWQNQTVSRIIQYFYRNLSRALTMDDIAAEAGLSSGYISSLFRKYTGSAPLVFFTRLKMEKACYLLRTSGMNVSEVGQALGYSDPYYFSRVFRRTIVQAPGQYRKAQM